MESPVLQELLVLAESRQASDLHLVVDHPPVLRIHGELVYMDQPSLTAADIEGMMYASISEKQKKRFLDAQELDFSRYSEEDQTYYRVNMHVERGRTAATIRIMPKTINSAAELGLPPATAEICKKRKGLVMMIGSSGSGKTTTMNYMVDLINKTRSCKIITIEDPIEFYHRSKKGLVVQREVGTHTQTFATALKYALRQDPDVVVIGEMRDLESIAMALTTAETGHLVLTTLHAQDAIDSINRIIDVFPSEQQNQIRIMLAETLVAVIGQNLLPSRAGGRVLASEVLVPTMAIRNIIRRGALQEIRGQMETGGDYGMYTIEQCLSFLVKRDMITVEQAKEYAKFPNLLRL